MSAHPLTQEMQQVVGSNARLLVVDAFAGSGKTSTLVAYAKARPNARTLYIAFNKSVATEAANRFPQNVECRTTHSLAFGAMGRKFADKLGNPSPFMIGQMFHCNPRMAKNALQTVSAWLCSWDPEITLDHVTPGVESPEEAGAVVDLARRVWAEMQNTHSSMKMPHDGYLKLWAMSSPRLRYDIILLDEAQDTNPVTLELVLTQQQATLVLVGDRHQGIYGFRKAMNAMQEVRADERVALTRSFRFGEELAQVATRLLQAFKDEPLEVKGRPDLQVSWEVDRGEHYALIGRTNAGLFAAAVQLVQDRGERRLHFVGGFESYMFGKVLDAYYLWSEQLQLIKDSTILRFRSFSDFRKYGQEADDPEVKALVKVVETYESRIPELHAALKSAETTAHNAEVTLATAHKAKGLEWDQVELADDFVDLPPADDTDPEEINLLYVGITRAKRAVRLPGSVTAWLAGKDSRPDRVPSRLAADDAPSLAGEPLSADDIRERRLRNHPNLASQFGGDAAEAIAFLLQRLTELRQTMRSPLP